MRNVPVSRDTIEIYSSDEDESPLALEDCKRQVLKNLALLQQRGVIRNSQQIIAE